MHLPSKMRFISAQFEALLSGELWRRSATHANRMARMLATELEKVPGIKLTQPVESNGVFAVIPEKHIAALQKKYFFYVWNEEISECRFMASFDTSEEDIHEFVALVRKIVKWARGFPALTNAIQLGQFGAEHWRWYVGCSCGAVWRRRESGWGRAGGETAWTRGVWWTWSRCAGWWS